MKHSQAELERIVAAARVFKEFKAEVAATTASYSQAEIDTFSTQEAEAKAWFADKAAPTPLLDAILSASGDTKEALATSILAKASALKGVVGKAIGKKQKAIKELN
jgi:hypothetical protein